MGATRQARHVICLVAVAILASAQAEPAATVSLGPAPNAGDVERGRAVVVGATPQGQQAACMQCHGLDGYGDPAAGFPRLSGLSADYLLKSLQDYAADRRQNPIMGPIAKAMSPEEMRTSSAYYASLGPSTRTTPSAEPPSERLQRGAVLAALGDAKLAVQACQNCHGPAGLGLGYGYPALAGQHPSYLEAQLRAWKDGSRRGDPLNAMQIVAERLTDTDIAAVSAYFGALPPPGRPQAAGRTSP